MVQNDLVTHLIEKYSDKVFLLSLKKELQRYSQRIYIDAQAHDNFCNKFKLNYNIGDVIYKALGITSAQLKKALEPYGLIKNTMYTDPSYQALLMTYLIGVAHKDEELRKLALFFILVRLYNGLNSKYFSNGCQENIMRHVHQFKMDNKSLGKNKGPLEVVAYFVDTLDQKYNDEIKKDPKKMLLRLFAQSWGRLNQMLRAVAQKYYEVHKNGESGQIVSTLTSDEQGHLRINEQVMENTISIVIDKFNKAKLIKSVKMPLSEVQFLANKLTVTTQAVQKIEDWINDSNNEEKIDVILAYILRLLKIQNENDINKYPTFYTAEKIANKKDKNQVKIIKENVDEALKEIFGEKVLDKISTTQKLKLRKLFIAVLFFLFKMVVTKDKKFERMAI